MGRPTKEIDAEQVYKLAAIGCSYEEIANVFNVNRSTIIARFQDEVKAGHSDMKESIRRAQLKVALDHSHKGQVTMLIWLGKQLLGQRDTPIDASSPVKKVTLEKIE